MNIKILCDSIFSPTAAAAFLTIVITMNQNNENGLLCSRCVYDVCCGSGIDVDDDDDDDDGGNGKKRMTDRHIQIEIENEIECSEKTKHTHTHADAIQWR